MKTMPNIVLAIIAGVIAMLAIVAAVVANTHEGPSWPQGSPEAAVHAYVQAVAEQDHQQALALMDPKLECTEEDFRQAYYPEESVTALLDTHQTGDYATVSIEIGNTVDPLSNTYGAQETIELTQADGQWLITGYPWPTYGCEASYE